MGQRHETLRPAAQEAQEASTTEAKAMNRIVDERGNPICEPGALSSITSMLMDNLLQEANKMADGWEQERINMNLRKLRESCGIKSERVALTFRKPTIYVKSK